ncbi:MAG: hypothetical protein NTX08_02280 [Sphingobacteriales bacterium]|nr:hypothetical protein [Sphingobacteriales bacterium]
MDQLLDILKKNRLSVTDGNVPMDITTITMFILSVILVGKPPASTK